MLFRSALLIAGAGLAVAQSLSSNCTSALLAVATSPETTCLDLTLLAPLVLSNNSNTSAIPTFNTWLAGMCSQGPCSNTTLQAAVTNITNGCSTDLASFGFTIDSNVTTFVQAAYPTIREIACLEDTSANTLCATELLTDVQTATGVTLSIDNIITLIAQGMAGQNMNIPQNVTCSNCSKAAYTIAAQKYPALQSTNQSAIQAECGTSFTDGQMPSGIQESTANSTSTGGATSLSVNSFNIGVAMLAAVSSTFAIFV